MATENFKVRKGLTIGESATTIDAVTGDIVTTGDVQVGGNDIKMSGGTTAITFSGAGNVAVAGDLTVTGNDINSSTGSPITLSGNDVTVNGDLAVNGGDITTNQTTFNLLNTTATTLNVGGAATTIEIGAATGTTNVNNDLVVDGTVTINGSTSGGTTISAPATGSTLSYVLPGSSGAANTVLTNDGSGNLTWALPGGGGSTFGNVTVGVATDNTVSTTTGNLVLDSFSDIITVDADTQLSGNKSIQMGTGVYAGSTDIWRQASGATGVFDGVEISNGSSTNSTAVLVMRQFGQSTSGGGTATVGEPRILTVGSRGTQASPLAVNANNSFFNIGSYTNLGDNTGGGTGVGYSNDIVLAANAALTFRSSQNHRQTLGATFTASISGTTLTVTAMTSGTIVPGTLLKATVNPVVNAVAILRQTASTEVGNALGGAGTYVISSAVYGTRTAETFTTLSITQGSAAAISVTPPNISSTGGITAFNATWDTSNYGLTQLQTDKITVTSPYSSAPQYTRTVTAITGGDTLTVTGHGLTATGATFVIAQPGNPNGLTTNTAYYVDTIVDANNIKLRTNSVSGGAVTGLTNGTGLFLRCEFYAQNRTGANNVAPTIDLIGYRWGNNFQSAVPAANKTNDYLGQLYFSGTTGAAFPSGNVRVIGQATQDFAVGAYGSQLLLQTTKNSTTTAADTARIGLNSTTFLSDSFLFENSAGTDNLTIDSSGNVVITGDLRINGNDIQASDGNTNITMNSNTLTTFAGDIKVNGNDIQNSAGNNNISLGNTFTTIRANTTQFYDSNAASQSNIQFEPGNTAGATASDRNTSFALFHRRIPSQPSEYPNAGFSNWILDTGTGNYQPNLSGETLGELYYNGQYSTGSSPTSNGPSVRFEAQAAENYTAAANGGRGLIRVVQKGTTGTLVPVFSGDSDNITMKSGRTEVQTVAGSVLQRIDPTESWYRSGRFVYGQVVGGSTIFDITDNGSTGITSVYSNPYATSTTGVGNVTIAVSNTQSLIDLDAYSTDGSNVAGAMFQSTRRSGGNNAVTQLGDRLGQLRFNGNTNTGTGQPSAPVTGGEIRVQASENWTGSATGTQIGLEVTKTGTTNNVTVFLSDSISTEVRGDTITLADSTGTPLTSAGINYTRSYGEFAYTNAAGFAIAAQNTIYTMPLDTTLNNSGVTISGTGEININVSGWYKIIMSLQITLTVSNQPGQIDFWLRKNGVDVANSKTQVDLLKDQKAVIAMDWLVNSDGNDYWEIVYVGTTANYADIDFPTVAATTTPYVSPVAPALLVNVIPAGA